MGGKKNKFLRVLVPAPQLRKGLFDMVVNGSAAETRLATECLRAIDEIRDYYGHVDSEPRHPDIQRGLSGQAPMYQTRFRGGGVFLGIEVDDADLVFEELRAQGHRIVVPLTNEPWGRRHFGILDPNGVPIDIYSHVAPMAEMAGCARQAAAV